MRRVLFLVALATPPIAACKKAELPAQLPRALCTRARLTEKECVPGKPEASCLIAADWKSMIYVFHKAQPILSYVCICTTDGITPELGEDTTCNGNWD